MSKIDITFLDILRLKWKHRKLLLQVFVLAAILSAVLSFLLPVQYLATAILFPAKSGELVVNDYGLRRANMSEIGEAEEAEQFLEIMNSTDFKMKLVHGLDLYKHYEVDTTSATARTDVLNALEDGLSWERTRFNAVKIEVVDKDAHKAAEIANYVLDAVDEYRQKMVMRRSASSIEHLWDKERVLTAREEELQLQISRLNAKGVVALEERAGLYEAAGGSTVFRSQIDSNLRYAAEYDVLSSKLVSITERLDYVVKAQDQILSQSEGALSQKFDVQRARMPEKKHKPRRSLVTLIGAVAASSFALLVLLVMEKGSNVRHLLEE